MERLGWRDLKKVFGVVSDLYRLQERSTFIDATLTHLNALIPSDRISYNEVDLERREARIVWAPADDALLQRMKPVFEAHVHEHPMAAHLRTQNDLRVIYRLSDYCSCAQFQRTALYQEYYKELGTKYQLVFSLQKSSRDLMPFALNRHDRDFSDRDRAVLSLLIPHLIQALHNAERLSRLQAEVATLKMGLQACGIVALRVSDGGVIGESGDFVTGLFQRYGLHQGHRDRLPPVIWEWIQQSEQAGKSALLATPRCPLRLSCATHQATIQYVRDQDALVLVIEETFTTMPPSALLPLGLSRREAEILSWVAQGKTNEDIATILTLSPRTVQKHLEHIFGKLGVETRTAATACAIEAARHYRSQHSV